jgi:asparagine synthase (glutamine-hydrolysing)
MCGVAGIFGYGNAAPPVRVEEIIRIREAMQPRGPDGAGLWLSPDKQVTLAHRRLAIIDLSEAGAQPMGTADRTVWVVFNGEIYNYRELRDILETKGCRFQSHSDTEVLLHLYQE